MPIHPQSEVSEAAQKVDATVAAERQAELAAGAPEPTEPLDPMALSQLSAAVAETVGNLSQGAIPAKAEQYTEPMEQFPPDLFSMVATLEQFFAQTPEAEPYQFSAQDLTTSQAVQEAAIQIGSAGEDQELVRAMLRPMDEAPAPEAPAEGPPAPDASRFVAKK